MLNETFSMIFKHCACLGCQDWRLVNNSKCEKHLRNHKNCQYDYWDCLENDEKETIAKQICTLMKECCDFIRFQGTCQDVDFSYSWAWTLQQLKDGLKGTVFENHRKSRIQHCERSELRLHFEWTKVD